ncbi:MAG TPA: hypothetical protein VEY11_00425 [Pyrinomonadaceae bacterium]|nr:hypothetical protein [Pyrinomonadaceae bacterium]
MTRSRGAEPEGAVAGSFIGRVLEVQAKKWGARQPCTNIQVE